MAGRFTVETVFKGNDQVSSTIAGIQARAKAMERGLGGVGHFADKGIDGFKKVAAAAAVAGMAGVVGLGHVIEVGADFEHSITGVGAVMGKTRADIKDLEDEALNLGVKTQFSATQVAEAMEEMARKGFDSEEILHGIPGVLDAIAASGEGMSEVAQVVGSSIRGFGLDAERASHVADVLAFSAERTGAKITDMGTALAIAAPTAHALGVSIEDTAASVGLLQKMGIDASTAGSATATMLAKISHPSKEAAQQMAALGVKFQDAKGDMLPFRDVLGQFVHAGDKVGGNMKRMAFFAELVGLRGDKAALGLAAMAKSGDFDKLADGLARVDGYAHKVAMMRLDDTKGSWKLLTSTIEVLETKIEGLGSGGLKDVIDKTNAWLTANQDLIVSGVGPFVQDLVSDAEKLADNIGFGVSMLDNFKDGLVAAFEDSTTVKVFGDVLGAVFGGNDSAGPRIQAYELGNQLGNLVDDFGIAIGLIKGAELATWAFANSAKIAAAGTWAWEGAVTATKWAHVALGTAEVGVTGTTVAFGSSMTAASLGAGELALSEEAAAIAAAEMEAAAIGAEAGIAGIGVAAGVALAPIAAIAAAIAAVAAAGYEASQFMNENGGASGTWSGIKGVFGVGTKDWGLTGMSEGIDAKMNEQAKVEAAQREQNTNAGIPTFSETVAGNSDAGRASARSYDRLASGYGPALPQPVQVPQVVSSRDQHSDAQAQSSAQLQQTIRELTAKIGQTNGTLTVKLPKGVTGELTGAPGVEVSQSGSF